VNEKFRLNSSLDQIVSVKLKQPHITTILLKHCRTVIDSTPEILALYNCCKYQRQIINTTHQLLNYTFQGKYVKRYLKYMNYLKNNIIEIRIHRFLNARASK